MGLISEYVPRFIQYADGYRARTDKEQGIGLEDLPGIQEIRDHIIHHGMHVGGPEVEKTQIHYCSNIMQVRLNLAPAVQRVIGLRPVTQMLLYLQVAVAGASRGEISALTEKQVLLTSFGQISKC